MADRGPGRGLPQLPDLDLRHETGEEVQELPHQGEVCQDVVHRVAERYGQTGRHELEYRVPESQG